MASELPSDAIVAKDQAEGSYVYFLMNGDECIYVGKTCNLKRRLAAHRSKRTFTHAVFIHVAPEVRRDMERRWIAKIMPKQNINSGGYEDPIRVCIVLPRKLWHRLREVAKQRNINRNRLIVDAIEEEIRFDNLFFGEED